MSLLRKKPAKSWEDTHANIKLPATLHASMKAIQLAREQLERADVTLCSIYREAVEQYVSAEPQQRLLMAGSKGKRRGLRPSKALGNTA